MKQITPRELKELQEKGPIFLLDVREPFEHEAYNIGGQLSPLDSVMNSAGVIPRDVPVVVYCKRGVRSQIAIQRLEERFGFTNLINLQGGMEAWKQQETE